MGFAIGILLLILSAIGTLCAFGGRTWLENDQPWLKRITRRGWIALACLTMATSAGIAKAYLDSEHSRAASDRLDEQRRAILKQGADLSQARAALERESIANLLTILSGPNRIVGAQFDLSVKGGFHDVTSIGELLFPELPLSYRDMARVRMEVHTPSGSAQRVASYNDTNLGIATDDLGQETYVFSSGIGLTMHYSVGDIRNADDNAATGYSALAKGALVANFHLSLVKQSSSRAEIARFDRSHPDLDGFLRTAEQGFEKSYAPPPSIADAKNATTRPRSWTISLTMRQPGEEDSPVVISADVVCTPTYEPLIAFSLFCKAHGSPRMEMADYTLR
jgi:hypothetical protein